MAKKAILVKYGVKPGMMNKFLSVLRDHISKTRLSEQGCLQFDVLLPDGEHDSIRLYELYADEEAFKKHNASAQLAKYRTQSDPMLNERSILACTVRE